MNEEESLLDRDARIASLATSVLELRDEAVTARVASGIETQWREAQKLYEGSDGSETKIQMMDVVTGEAWGSSKQKKQKSK